MPRCIRTSAILSLGTGVAVALSLVLLADESETAAHEGHDTDMWEFTWNRGTTERLLRYRFWHYNTYTKQRCDRYNQYTSDCDNWVETGETRTRTEDSCAARPEWVVATLDAERNQDEPDPPSGATCDRHDSYLDGEDRWVFSSHETKRIEVDSTTGPLRCRLPGTNIQSADTSTDTDPPGGKSPVYRSSQTQPSRGSPARCGWWSGARRHPPEAVATTGAPETTPSTTPPTEETTTTTTSGTTTTTVPRPTQEPGWTRACYETFQLGELMGDRQNPEIPLPWYNGADKIYHSGRLPQGVKRVRIEGEQYLYGQAQGIGTFNGRLAAWRGRTRLSTQDCVIVVTGGTWTPSVCEFFLEVGASYDLSMPRLRGALANRYYATGGLPPGLSSSSSRVSGSPTSEGSWPVAWRAVIDGVSTRPTINCTFHVAAPAPPGWSGTCDWTFTAGYSYTRLLPVASGATIHRWTGDIPDGMLMRLVRSGGVWAQQLSGTPTAEGFWEGAVAPYNPRPEGVDDLECSFEVLPGPDAAACSLTIPTAEIERTSDEIEWRSDLPRTNAHADIPGGDSYLFTTGDPGVGGGSPRIWPWWSSDDALTVTDTSGCEWRMVEVLSAARPLFPWYGNGLDVIRQVAPAMHAQWQAMTRAQQAEVEATGRRALRTVGLGTPEDGTWLGNGCQPGDVPSAGCVWGLPFPGVWQWSLTVRYRSPDDFRQRDLTIASGATRFWRFADQVGR